MTKFLLQLSFLDTLYRCLHPAFFKQPHFFFFNLIRQLDAFRPPSDPLGVIILKVVLEETILPLVEGADEFVIRTVLLRLVLLVVDFTLFFMKETLFGVVV